MAANGITRGHIRPGKTPQFLTIGLLLVICILAFNYWNVSSRGKILQKEVKQMTSSLEQLAVKNVRLEKRSISLQSELGNINRVNRELRSLKANADTQKDDIEKQLGGMRGEFDFVKQQRDTHRNAAVELQGNFTETMKKLEITRTEIDDMQQEFEKYQEMHDNRIKQHKDEVAKILEQVRECDVERTQVQITKDSLQTLLQKAQLELQRLQKQCNAQPVIPNSNNNLPPLVPVQTQQLPAAKQPQLQQQPYQQPYQGQDLLNQLQQTHGQYKFKNVPAVNTGTGAFGNPPVVHTGPEIIRYRENKEVDDTAKTVQDQDPGPPRMEVNNQASMPKVEKNEENQVDPQTPHVEDNLPTEKEEKEEEKEENKEENKDENKDKEEMAVALPNEDMAYHDAQLAAQLDEESEEKNEDERVVNNEEKPVVVDARQVPLLNEEGEMEKNDALETRDEEMGREDLIDKSAEDDDRDNIEDEEEQLDLMVRGNTGDIYALRNHDQVEDI